LAQLSYSRLALDNLTRLVDFLMQSDPLAAALNVDLIDEAVSLLARHPLVGRPVEAGLRELVISRGRTGYVALYSYEEAADVVLILAIRHQREAGFRDFPRP
jgi:plasmid stabilization system protein ParE